MKSKKDLKLGFKLLTLVSSGNGHYIFNSLLHRTISCTKREMKNKTKSITHTKIQKKMRETREKDLVPESAVKWRRLKREAEAEGEMRDRVCMEVEQVGVAAVVAARVLRLEKRSLCHIVRAVSVYERERERVKLRSQVTPFLLL